jgi:hypothetical protein
MPMLYGEHVLAARDGEGGEGAGTGVSRGSLPITAAQDLAELDMDLAAITQAGGWKSPRMPLQYADKMNAARSGMARAAAATGIATRGPLSHTH